MKNQIGQQIIESQLKSKIATERISSINTHIILLSKLKHAVGRQIQLMLPSTMQNLG